MPLAGKGMLLTSMNIDAADEADFNRWYDREHLEERVAIEGFLEARRYVAHAANPEISLACIRPRRSTCSTAPPTGRGSPTRPNGRRRNMAHFKNMIRVVARITISNGTGRGAALGIVRLRPTPDNADAWRDALQEKLIRKSATASSRCICSRASRNCRARRADIPAVRNEGARDWFVLIDGTACRRGLGRDRRALHRPCRLAIPAARRQSAPTG